MKKIYHLSKRVIPVLCMLLLSTFKIHAQTTLATGDISIVGINSNSPDQFSFVSWVDLAPNTVIKFTDNGFNTAAASTASGNFREQEQYAVWTNNTGLTIAAGTSILISLDPTNIFTTTSLGTVTTTNSTTGNSTAGISLTNNTGDQIFAFQGTGGPSTGSLTSTFSGTLLFGIGYSGSTQTTTSWQITGTINGSTSYLPSDLSGTSQIFLGPGIVGAYYSGQRTGLSSMAAYKAAVANPANWTTATSGTVTFPILNSNFSAGTAPTITAQPSNSIICAGAPTTFSVTASNAISYQWQVNTGSGFTNISVGAPYAGTLTSTLVITSATVSMNGYLYQCVATGLASPAATSNSATLTVNPAPAITTQPTASIICAGATTTFTVAASSATGYQWQVDQGLGYANIPNGAPYSGATTATLTITAATAGLTGYAYRAVATGSCTPAATSNGVVLTVNAVPVITTQPGSSVICAGANTTFNIAASHATGYQWQVDQGAGYASIPNGAPYSGATTATLTITAATVGLTGYAYRVIVTGTCTPAATSNGVLLTVNPAPAITTQPTSGAICPGGTKTFAVVASNATGYQWQVDQGLGYVNIINIAPYSGATTATLTITAATAGLSGYSYRVVITGACTPTATSTGVVLTVNPPAAITTQPTSSTICSGANTTFSIAATNATGYQWQVDQGSGYANITNGAPYSGATTATLTLTAATAGLTGYAYRAVVTGGCAPTATSNGVLLTVNATPAITTQPTSSTICSGANTTFSIAATNATGYQWQVDQGAGYANISNGATYSGATTSTLTITAATSGLTGYAYRVIATGGCIPNATSNGVLLTVNASPAITTQPTSGTICSGANTTLSIAATNATGYQWQVDQGSGYVNIANGAPYSGATTTTLNITAAPAGLTGYAYRAVVTGSCIPNATSNGVLLTVNAAPAIINQPSASTICVGANTTFSVSATNATAYQWQVDQGTGFVNISNGALYSGATTSTLTVTAATTSLTGYTYRVVATGGCIPAGISSAVLLTVNAAPAITTQPTVSTICSGANTTFSIAATNATAYQWQVDEGSGYVNITNGAPYSGATTATLTITAATAGLTGNVYRAIATGSCVPAATSNGVLLTVNAAALITTQPLPSTICGIGNTTFSVAATNATAYQWQVDNGSGYADVVNDVTYSGATTETLSITPATASMDGYVYRVLVSNTCLPEVVSDGALLSTADGVNPVIADCPSDVTFSVTAGTCGAEATWTAPTATDNCSIAVLTSDHDSGDIFPTGSTVVTYTAMDAAGNVSTCSFTVNVTDDENPVFTTCPADAAITTGVYTFIPPVATDNCSGVTVVQISGLVSGAIFPEGETIQTYEATDASGNTETCSFTITASLATSTHLGKLINIDVYPNPASDVVYITSNTASANEYEIIMQDISGKIILQKNMHSENNFRLDVKDLSKGIYFLIIRDASNQKVEKIIIE